MNNDVQMAERSQGYFPSIRYSREEAQCKDGDLQIPTSQGLFSPIRYERSALYWNCRPWAVKDWFKENMDSGNLISELGGKFELSEGLLYDAGIKKIFNEVSRRCQALSLTLNH